MNMDQLDKEIAEKVILPKLKMLALADTENEIVSVASMRRHFNQKFEESISAAKFQSWIDLLGIKFKKQVVIVWPSTAAALRPPASAPEDLEESEPDERSEDFPPVSSRSMMMDAFNQMQ